MTRYAIFACDEMYGGLHGMNYTGVVEADSENEVEDIAIEEAFCIIESYSDIYKVLEEEVEKYIEEDMTEDEIEELRNEIYMNDIQVTWELIDESIAKNYTTKELDNMCYNMTYSDFIKEYCLKI